MEKVITCGHCGDNNHAFEEVQEDINSYMCFQCGFMSDKRFTKEYDDEASKNMAILMNQLKHFDLDRKIYWYPCVLNMGKLGMIYPEPDVVDEKSGKVEKWSWKFAKVEAVKEGDKVPEGYNQKLDVDNAKVYKSNDFMTAIKDMGITKDLTGEKN